MLPLNTIDVPGGKEQLTPIVSLGCNFGGPPGPSVEGDVLSYMPSSQVFLALQAGQDSLHCTRLDPEVIPDAVLLPAAFEALDCGRATDTNSPCHPVPDSVRGQVTHSPDADPATCVGGPTSTGTILRFIHTTRG